jgi:hypothetical protein
MLLCVFDISIYFLGQIFWAKKSSRGDIVFGKDNILSQIPFLKNCQIVTENWFFGGRVSPHSPLLLSIYLWVVWKRVASKVEICLGMLTILATSGNWGKKKQIGNKWQNSFLLKKCASHWICWNSFVLFVQHVLEFFLLDATNHCWKQFAKLHVRGLCKMTFTSCNLHVWLVNTNMTQIYGYSSFIHERNFLVFL